MKKIKFIIVFLMALLVALPVYAIDKNAGTAGGQFLTVGPGARPSGMGGAFTGLANDVNTVWWNPAGMGFFQKPQAMFMHDESFQNMSYEYLAYVHHPVWDGKSVFGGAVTYVNEASNIKKTTITSFQNGTDLGNFDAYDLALTGGYAYRYSNDLSLGVNLRYIHQSIDKYDVNAFGADLGFLYKPPNFPGLSIGLTAQNIGTSLKFQSRGDKAPINVRTGFGYVRPLRDNLDKLTLVLDLNVPVDDAFYVQGGAEYWIQNMLMIRAGYNGQADDLDNGLTLGAGFNYQNWFLDYAFTQFGKLGDSHRASITYKFQ